MGGKRRRQGIYIYLFIALVMFMFTFGCTESRNAAAPLERIDTVQPIEVELKQARQFLARGDYEPALNTYRKIFEEFRGTSAAGEALYNIGVIFAHPDNRNRDYQRALESFRRVVSEYPRNQRVIEARVLIGLLTENVKLKQTVADGVKENSRLKQMIKESREVDLEIEEKKREEKR